MFRRDISLNDVKIILEKGETIREYSNDKPYPGFLLLGIADHRPLHLLVARDTETGRCIMVTVYEPDKNVWTSDYKTKIR